MHVNVTKGGFFSVYDKVHYLDARTFKPVIISQDVAPKGKHKKQFNRLLAQTEETEDLNRLWLIVRYMKSCSSDDLQTVNKFTLRGGERIKIGRVIFTVKELVNSQVKYYAKDAPVAANSGSDQTSSSHSRLETPGLLLNTDDGLFDALD